MDAQARFAEEYGVKFPLLADEGSEVIRRFGILNTLIREDEPIFGIPYPGSYLVGEDGRVQEKFFNREYQVRETGVTVLRSGFGVDATADGPPRAQAASPGVQVTAELGADELKFMQRADLYVRLRLDEGLHVYGLPIPEGYYATEVRVSGPEDLRVGEARYPSTQPFHVEGLNEQFRVFEGDVEIAVPLVAALREGESVPIDVEVSYQACTDRECYPPATQRLHLDVPLGKLNMPQRRR